MLIDLQASLNRTITPTGSKRGPRCVPTGADPPPTAHALPTGCLGDFRGYPELMYAAVLTREQVHASLAPLASCPLSAHTPPISLPFTDERPLYSPRIRQLVRPRHAANDPRLDRIQQQAGASGASLPSHTPSSTFPHLLPPSPLLAAAISHRLPLVAVDLRGLRHGVRLTRCRHDRAVSRSLLWHVCTHVHPRHVDDARGDSSRSRHRINGLRRSRSPHGADVPKMDAALRRGRIAYDDNRKGCSKRLARCWRIPD